MPIRLPDLETVELLHEVVLSTSTGKEGIHDKKLIVSAVERPNTYVRYVDRYDIDTICALLVDSIARYHGFRDGNKRTALLTAVFTYRINGVHFKATAKMNVDFDDLVMWVVRKKPSIDNIVKRLKELRKLHEGDRESWFEVISSFVRAKINHDEA